MYRRSRWNRCRPADTPLCGDRTTSKGRTQSPAETVQRGGAIVLVEKYCTILGPKAREESSGNHLRPRVVTRTLMAERRTMDVPWGEYSRHRRVYGQEIIRTGRRSGWREVYQSASKNKYLAFREGSSTNQSKKLLQTECCVPLSFATGVTMHRKAIDRHEQKARIQFYTTTGYLRACMQTESQTLGRKYQPGNDAGETWKISERTSHCLVRTSCLPVEGRSLLYFSQLVREQLTQVCSLGLLGSWALGLFGSCPPKIQCTAQVSHGVSSRITILLSPPQMKRRVRVLDNSIDHMRQGLADPGAPVGNDDD